MDLWRVQRADRDLAGSCRVHHHRPLFQQAAPVLAIHGDYRVMAQGDFRIGLNEVQVGLFPGGVIHGAFRRLVSAVTPASC